MENAPAFVNAMAHYRVCREQHKPLLRKPFLRFGQCLFLAAHFFQIGGVLGARYCTKLDEFGWAFLGFRGEAGDMSQYFGEYIQDILAKASDSRTILEYVERSEAPRIGFKGDLTEFWLQPGLEIQKISPDTAIQLCWEYAFAGSALGAMHADVFRRLFAETVCKKDEQSWQLARSCGLDIPEQQETITYEEVEQVSTESFLSYCQEYAPNLHAALVQ